MAHSISESRSSFFFPLFFVNLKIRCEFEKFFFFSTVAHSFRFVSLALPQTISRGEEFFILVLLSKFGPARHIKRCDERFFFFAFNKYSRSSCWRIIMFFLLGVTHVRGNTYTHTPHTHTNKKRNVYFFQVPFAMFWGVAWLTGWQPTARLGSCRRVHVQLIYKDERTIRSTLCFVLHRGNVVAHVCLVELCLDGWSHTRCVIRYTILL